LGKILPSIRAAIVKILIEEYRLKQTENAGLLGISQSAVSQYYTSTRGADDRFLLLFPEILKYAREVADDLVKGKIDGAQISLCIPCQLVRKNRKF